jgi:mRNA-degrading endonuclease toxin of MazEF toxin-antitoxin module
MPNPNKPLPSSSGPSSASPTIASATATSTTAIPTVAPPQPQRGDVYWVNIPKKHTVGSEQYKRRPFLIVSNNAIHHLRIVIGVPLSFRIHKINRQYRIQVLASEIIMDTGSTLDPGERVALTEQVRCLAVERLEPVRQARVTDTAVYAVEAGVAFVMDIR